MDDSGPQEHPHWPVTWTIHAGVRVQPLKCWGLFVRAASTALTNELLYPRPASVRPQSPPRRVQSPETSSSHSTAISVSLLMAVW